MVKVRKRDGRLEESVTSVQILRATLDKVAGMTKGEIPDDARSGKT